MTRSHGLAIDQGITNTKAQLIDAAGSVVAQAASAPSVRYPQPAWVEQDPLALWRTVQETVDRCLQAVDRSALAAVAVTNQHESVMLWERRTGRASCGSASALRRSAMSRRSKCSWPMAARAAMSCSCDFRRI
jgi:glycerol kinase